MTVPLRLLAGLAALGLWLSACGAPAGAPPSSTPLPGPSLSGLQVLVTLGGGTSLTPAFSPAVTEYSLSLIGDVDSIGVIPSLSSPSVGQISVDGNPVLPDATATVSPKVGKSQVKIVVSAGAGSSTTYTIAVNREDFQPLVDKFLKLSFTDPQTGVTMGYRLFVPEAYDPAHSYPLVMFLHGAGQVGGDNEIQVANDEATIWARPAEQSKRPCFVLAPQSNMDPSADKANNNYGKLGWTSLMWYGLNNPFDPQDQLVTAYDILQKVKSAYSIDPKRIYLTGLSM